MPSKSGSQERSDMSCKDLEYIEQFADKNNG